MRDKHAELDHAEMHSAPTSERPYVFSTEQQTETSQHGNRSWWPRVCWWRKSCRQQLAIEELGAEKAATATSCLVARAGKEMKLAAKQLWWNALAAQALTTEELAPGSAGVEETSCGDLRTDRETARHLLQR